MATKTKSRKRRSTRNGSDEPVVKGRKALGAELALIQSGAYVGDDLSKVAWLLYNRGKVDVTTAEIGLGDLKRLLEQARGDEFRAEVREAIKELKSLIAKAEAPKRRWPWSR